MEWRHKRERSSTNNEPPSSVQKERDAKKPKLGAAPNANAPTPQQLPSIINHPVSRVQIQALEHQLALKELHFVLGNDLTRDAIHSLVHLLTVLSRVQTIESFELRHQNPKIFLTLTQREVDALAWNEHLRSITLDLTPGIQYDQLLTLKELKRADFRADDFRGKDGSSVLKLLSEIKLDHGELTVSIPNLAFVCGTRLEHLMYKYFFHAGLVPTSPIQEDYLIYLKSFDISTCRSSNVVPRHIMFLKGALDLSMLGLPLVGSSENQRNLVSLACSLPKLECLVLHGADQPTTFTLFRKECWIPHLKLIQVGISTVDTEHLLGMEDLVLQQCHLTRPSKLLESFFIDSNRAKVSFLDCFGSEPNRASRRVCGVARLDITRSAWDFGPGRIKEKIDDFSTWAQLQTGAIDLTIEDSEDEGELDATALTQVKNEHKEEEEQEQNDATLQYFTHEDTQATIQVDFSQADAPAPDSATESLMAESLVVQFSQLEE